MFPFVVYLKVKKLFLTTTFVVAIYKEYLSYYRALSFANFMVVPIVRDNEKIPECRTYTRKDWKAFLTDATCEFRQNFALAHHPESTITVYNVRTT